MHLSNKPKQYERLPSLDGLRGLAILIVLIHHCNVLAGTTQAGRWYKIIADWEGVGVTLTFALSGFLITRVLLQAKGKPGFFAKFYARRMLRTAPLYYGLLLLILIAVPLLGFAKPGWSEMEGFRWTFPLYLQNYAMAAKGSFLNGGLGVTWSLAVEQQFYLVWPLLVAFLAPGRLMKLCLGLFVGTVLLRSLLWIGGVSGLAIYVMTPTRVGAILLGAAACVFVRDGSPAMQDRLAKAAWPMTAIVLAGGVFARSRGMNIIDDPICAVLLMPPMAVTWALLLIWGARADATGRRTWLHAKPLKYLGTISYSVFLLHLPIRAVIRDWILPPANYEAWFGSEIIGQLIFYLVTVPPILAICHLTFNYFEKPFLNLQDRFRVKPKIEPIAPVADPLPVRMEQSSQVSSRLGAQKHDLVNAVVAASN